ncbi:MAG: hypothetical protein A2007_00115 [Verrucomicrobia bacterium GWC2_42_7]|nr:MAG: hypothetical protein A2007_00115 [Verrucomicrobia bacterium GWC2_42_7]
MFYPIQEFSDFLTNDLFKIDDKTLNCAINFFIFDTLKILILLLLIIFSVAFVRSAFPLERIKRILSSKNRYIGHAIAATIGIITPFCSCSAVPLFLGFNEIGVPLGVTFSFLISSPMINEVALTLLLGSFGLKIALIYVVSGWLIAVFSGLIIGFLKPESLLKQPTHLQSKQPCSCSSGSLSWRFRISSSLSYTFGILGQIWPYVVLGVAMGAFIHGYVPADFLARYAGSDKWYAVPLATFIGIPLYSNAAGVIPIVSSLAEKGVSFGTSLAFMMAVTGLSLPEFIILNKLMTKKLITLFALIVGLGIIFTGYLFNFLI